ncbi:endothelial cell-selective adhesion molecule-like [Oppia nitens]|uniref:endothelial cell-selective adhesion molecule-like n=1 Tax=Oppia nitens TaxID=1686743 RepID=UPI0023DA0AA4|nr:endothelial cell-selective adhesion molecule-like [Oppia nitens]
MFYLLFLLFLLIFAHSVVSLRLIMLDVPSPSYVGESVELTCSYDLGDDRLYSVKWYKNDVEFYRYVPKDWPPGQFLPIPGIRVDLSRSGKNSVFLKQVDIHTAGLYRCEVSAEAPSFVTAEGQKVLEVTVLPSQGPSITGIQSKYKLGQIVSLNCTSAKSKPSASLKWYINDQEIGSEYETIYSTTLHSDGLETSSLSLKFIANEKHFKNANIRFKCMATISRMYTMSDEAFGTSADYKASGSLNVGPLGLGQVRGTASSIAKINSVWTVWLAWSLSLISTWMALRHHNSNT